MKKKFLFLLCLWMVPLLTGCWDRVEMHDLAIITAAAVDRLENGEIRVSVQLFIPRAITSGETGEDPSAGSTFVREGTADNLANAISMLQVNVPRRLFWGQCKVFILGNTLAESGIRDEIDFLTRHPDPRGNSYLFVSEGAAKEMITLVPPLERYSGEALKKLTEDEEGIATTLRDVDMGLMGDSKSVSIPLIKKLEPKEEAKESHQTIPVIDGAAIFKGDQMVGTLSKKESRSLLWLKDKVKRSTLSVRPKGEDGDIVMTPTLGKVKFSPSIQENKWMMNLSIDVEGDIVQNETHLNLMNEDVIKKLEREFETELQERIAQTLNKLRFDYQADVIDIGRRFHQFYPKEWNRMKDQWDEQFQEVEINIRVNSKIRRPGYIGPPAALPRDEVKE